MENFNFYAPTYFAFGDGAETQAAELVRRFGGSRVLLHYGGGSVVKNGVYDKVAAALTAGGVPFVALGGVQPNPRASLVYEGIDLCRREGVDFILAVGGGSVIDSAKAIAAGVPYEGDFWDFLSGKAKLERTLGVGAVVTLAAAGSEGSGSCVITRDEGMLKWAFPTNDLLRPKFSIMNPRFTCTLPPYQTACGITDMMAHILERYFTNTPHGEVTDRLCEGLLKAIIDAAAIVMAEPENYDARANLMWAGMLAHNNTCGVGREQDWASHRIEHELSAIYDCAHGAGLAVIMPAWMEYVMGHDVGRFAQFAVRVWGCEMDFAQPERTAREGIARFRQFLRSLGMPVNFAQLGAREEDIPRIMEHERIKGEVREGHFVILGDSDVEAILRLAARA